MKKPRTLLPWILGGLHFAFCVWFFTLYFLSHHPEKVDALQVFLAISPWLNLLSQDLNIGDPALAAIITILGTAQWWAIGKLWLWLFGKPPGNKESQAT